MAIEIGARADFDFVHQLTHFYTVENSLSKDAKSILRAAPSPPSRTARSRPSLHGSRD